jgi:hypothetical protein
MTCIGWPAEGGWAGAWLLPVQVEPPQLSRVTIDS